MNTLHLKLKKDVLIVDAPTDTTGTEVINQSGQTISINFYKDKDTFEPLHISEPGKWKFLCQGTPTEEQAADLVEKDEINGIHDEFVNGYAYLDYSKNLFIYFEKFTPLDSFLSAISSENWNWLVNPIDKPHNTGLLHTHPTGSPLMDESFKGAIKWQESESRTFKNPYIFIKE